MSRLTTAAHSSPEDIDAWTRAFAEDSASRAGMPLRDWLNQFLAQEIAPTECWSLSNEPGPQPRTSSGEGELNGPIGEGARCVEEQHWPAGGSGGELKSHCSMGTTQDAFVAPETADCAQATVAARPGTDEDVDRIEWWTAEPATGHALESLRDHGAETAAASPASDEVPRYVAEALTSCRSADDLCAEYSVVGAPGDVPLHARPELRDDEIEQALDDLWTRVDAVREKVSARMRQDTARALDGIERALRQMSEHSGAAEQAAKAGAGGVAERRQDGAPTQEQAPADTIERLCPDATLLAEPGDGAFERIKAINANQMAELRVEIAQVRDELASRIDDLERRSTPPDTEIDRQHSQTVVSFDLDFDSLNERVEPHGGDLGGRFDMRTAVAVDDGGSAASDPCERADSETASSAEFAIAVAEEDLAEVMSLRPAQTDGPSAVSGMTSYEHSHETSVALPFEISFGDANVLDQPLSQSQDPPPPGAKSTVLSWLGFRHGSQFRKSA